MSFLSFCPHNLNVMEPIQTKYKGYRFRSRLEARWAVFFDALDLEWIYEPEGFKLEDGTYYLPDFKVLTPYQFSHWYEIKPRGVTEDDKFDQFKDDLRGTVSGPPQRRFPHLLSGDPRAIIFDGSWGVCPRCGGVVDHVEGIPPGEVYCMPCDHTTPCGRNGEWQEGVLTGGPPYKGHLLLQRYDGPDYTDKYKRLLKNATRKARSARFEHGQKGA